VAFERNSDLNGALAKRDEAKQVNPEQPFLWSNYAYVAMRQSRFDDAKEDFRHELAHHPQESYVACIYAGMMLTSVQARKSVPDAIATLRRAPSMLPQTSPFYRMAGIEIDCRILRSSLSTERTVHHNMCGTDHKRRRNFHSCCCRTVMSSSRLGIS